MPALPQALQNQEEDDGSPETQRPDTALRLSGFNPRPVSGLASEGGTLGTVLLADRCGGSSGMAMHTASPDSRFNRQRRAGSHLKAWAS
jgi:hypothetical protein